MIMFEYLHKTRDRLRDWAIRHAEGPHAARWLSALSFSESSFFPIPPDILLIAIILSRKVSRWFYYAALTTVFSVLGGIAGYAIGYLFFDLFGQGIIAFYGLEEKMTIVQKLFSDNAFMAIFLAAFTPIPYKVFTIAAGVFSINLFPFVIASILGRGIRFFIVGYLAYLFGEGIRAVLYKYFNIISLVIAALVVLIAYLFL